MNRGFWCIVGAILFATSTLAWRNNAGNAQTLASPAMASDARSTTVFDYQAAAVKNRGLKDENQRQRKRPLLWRRANSRQETAACALVTSQLDAMADDNYAAATAMLTPDFARSVGEFSKFRADTQSHYPQLANYRRVDFDMVRADVSGRTLYAHCYVTGCLGDQLRVIYTLRRDQNGQFRIASFFAQRGEFLQDDAPMRPAVPERI